MTSLKKRVLFICKKRNAAYDNSGRAVGLYTSCKFIENALTFYGVDSKVVLVNDNNDIDREVTKYKPTHVFIEALWVVPEKFKVLIPLHPTVQWYVRIHSQVPFLALEGVSIEWLRSYHELSKEYPQLHVASNSKEFETAFREAYHIPVEHFPNIYFPHTYPKNHGHDSIWDWDEDCGSKKFLNIGCFGAIRPMKNQLNQALAAMAFGNQIGKRIRFHINGDRVEQFGDPVRKNIENAFTDTPHQLIHHPWRQHDEFIKLVKKMDIGMQVSFSETFNIVAADFVWNDIPVVGSPEITWLSCLYKANPNRIESMISKLYIAYYGRYIGLQTLNLLDLNQYNTDSIDIWLEKLYPNIICD